MNMEEKPLSTSVINVLAFYLALAAVLVAAGLNERLKVARQNPEELQAYNEYIVGRLCHNAVLPETKPRHPYATEVDQFYNAKVGPIWEKALAKGNSFYIEDYFDSMHAVVQVCKEARMPLYDGVVRLGGWNNLHNKAWALSASNGFRDPENEKNLRQISQEYRDVEETYQTWYKTGTLSVPQRPEMKWGSKRNFLIWTFLIYLEGLLISGIVYLLRMLADRYFSVREEVRFGALRFVFMLLVWPVGFWIYPHHTKTALTVRKLRLKAEFLRDKPRGYELSETEEKQLEELARSSRLSLRKLVKQVAEVQDRRQRKTLATVYALMLLGVTATCFARATILVHPVVLTEVVTGIQQADGLPDSRDGPSDSTQNKVPTGKWLALPGKVAEYALPRATRLTVSENKKAGPPGITKEIDHVPESALLLQAAS